MVSVQRAMLITGAASGIGAALARRVAAPGVGIVLHSGGSTPDSTRRMRDVFAACAESGAECVITEGDLAEVGVGAASVRTAIENFGRLDQIVHAAGGVTKPLLGDLTRQQFDRSIALMPGALLDILTEALPSLIASGAGRVVAVSSFIAHKMEPMSLAPASAAAKAAMEALVKCAALQLAPSGVTVNCVVPGFTRKDAGKTGALSAETWVLAAARTPTGRLNETDEVAAAIQFLLSTDARQITGAMLNVDGGLMLG